ncbi:dihydrolipoyl dehydrogenase [Arcobacter porcinus]|uniref:Dihydrolipoyl dehydrogenase n=1 Tax=Arcobacter porcinus TaxID=1935204 RepID=A0A5C2HJ36_9BACT|nr:dihydrolipoyl dehydrogenase [Arcobacter porcinus]OCL91364.1 Dihydrolipoyl dehydrogenase [Aliarcobacter thereius]QEP40318.1 pyruvate dehydrogenase multienzyme complex, E3 component dihydrolipoyl dehydrogenase [Arcobacter porcinus]
MNEIKTQVLVIGAGPGGYSAAFRSADLGLDTVIVERYPTLGGVCLNVGCIPSKALLHVAKVVEEAKHIKNAGIFYEEPKIDIEKVADYKNGVVKRLTTGLASMAKMRKVNHIQGYAKFLDENSVEVELTNGEKTKVIFENCIIAAGSQSSKMSFIPHEDPRIWDSTDALEVKEVPKKLLILGGGIIGLEMGTVYSTLGSEVDVAIRGEQLMTGTDLDIIKVYTKANQDRFNIMAKTQTQSIIPKKEGIYVEFKGENAPKDGVLYDAVLVALGRSANGNKLGLENTNVEVDEQGLIKVDSQLRTKASNIFAIGDIIGQPMLAHKAVHEGHVAAEVIAGHKVYFEPKQIPSIAYTFPEIASAGMSEIEAKKAGINYEVSSFPWSASGRALASDVANSGLTKLIFNKDTNQLIGGAIVGENAGELLGEISLALEMDCDAQDLALTIHAHPTLHESIGMAAEIFEGTITDFPNAKAVKRK